jgi:ATP-dependent RNA helicase RhlE
MLDMGFIHDVKRVVAALPVQRQTLLFSATMPQEIQDLAARMLVNPVRVEVTPQATTVEKIAQSVYFVEKQDKTSLLVHLLNDAAARRVLVFTRTKHGANKLVKQLDRESIQSEAIHGNKSQTARERALANFKVGRTRVLVATDIAARGIDVDDVTHVINYDLPNEPESYVHRIGRTARAGAAGSAYSFCDVDERAYLRDIEKLIRLRVPVVTEHPYRSPLGWSGSPALPTPSPRTVHPQMPRTPTQTAQPGKRPLHNSDRPGAAAQSGHDRTSRQPQAAGSSDTRPDAERSQRRRRRRRSSANRPRLG